MHHKREATLIYVIERREDDPIEIKKESIPCDVRNVFNNKYYDNLNRDIELTNTLKIRDYHKEDYKNGQLRYVEIDGKRYIIEKISETIQGRYILLDLSEDL